MWRVLTGLSMLIIAGDSSVTGKPVPILIIAGFVLMIWGTWSTENAGL